MVWEAARYQEQFSYVWRYGENLIELLAPQPGERILDLGCGTGQLTAQLAAAGATVVGLDRDANMLAEARRHSSDIEFVLADAADFSFSKPFDAVFSNAALHWMKDPAAVLACVAAALKPGGRFVAELGEKDNIAHVVAASLEALNKIGRPLSSDDYPWYFPSPGEYATLLEAAGFKVQALWRFPRPTPVDGGDAGLADWLGMFGARLFAHLSAGERAAAIALVEDSLRPALYRDGAWSVDYVRLRFVAVKR